VLLATEPVTSPKHPYAKWIYGAAIGIITMLFRHFGKVENAIPFAIIIANSITPLLDKIGTGIDKYTDISIKLPSFEFLKKFRKGGEVNER
jgi:Na+-translocating ferredoxin:NAD+ oxidoreductase RnfD subunit